MEPEFEIKLGAAKKTDVEEAVKHNFQGETSEVGLYLAMSKQALRDQR
jgi:rubrerythrin